MDDGVRAMPWRYDDGGRRAASYRGDAGDCAVRALAIATGRPYLEWYATVGTHAKRERPGSKRRRSSPRDGVHMETMRRILADLGWVWVPCMAIGSGCTTHLAVGEVPDRCIARVSRHYVAVVDGVVRDTHDSTRGGTRCVYGWWEPPRDPD